MRSALVVTEIAVAFVLVVASSLLLRSFVRVLDADLGFNPERLARLRVDPATRFKDLATATTYYDEVLRRVRAIPGVTDASLSDMLPFTGDRSWAMPAEGRTYQRGNILKGSCASSGRTTSARWAFRCAPVAISETPRRRDSPPVVIVNESMAHTLWPDRSAIGQRIRQGKELRDGDRRRGRRAARCAREPVHRRSVFLDASGIRVAHRSDRAHDAAVGAARDVRARRARARRERRGEECVDARAGRHRPRRVAAAVRRRAARRLRVVRVGARRARDLCVDLVRRHAASSGDRHSPRAGRVGQRRPRVRSCAARWVWRLAAWRSASLAR